MRESPDHAKSKISWGEGGWAEWGMERGEGGISSGKAMGRVGNRQVEKNRREMERDGCV